MSAPTAALMSLVSAILLPRVDLLSTFRFWQIGGVGGAVWDRIALVAPVLAVGAVVVLATARGMNSLALGDDLAAGLGENVGRTRLVAALGGVILCGAATAIAGPIGFVGLVVPHLIRARAGGDDRIVMPCAFLLGGVLLATCDAAGRVVLAPAEVPAGAITAFIGGPHLVWLVRRGGRG